MRTNPNRSRPYYSYSGLLTLLLLLLSPSNSVTADDTEIFFRHGSGDELDNRANILLLIDSSVTMGAGIDQAPNDSASQPQNHYYPSTEYPGDLNISGDRGNDQYYYLYQRRPQPQGLGELVYFNRLHRDQLRCDLSPALFNEAPYHSGADDYIFDTSAAGWDSLDWASSIGDPSISRPLCSASDAMCAFTSGPAGPAVDCRSQAQAVPQAAFSSSMKSPSLLAVTANYHNFLQAYYRYSALQTALRGIVAKNYPVNLALMKFNGDDGGYIVQPAVAADDSSGNSQRALRRVIDSTQLTAGSPLTESLWESWLYLTGKSARYGAAGNSAAFSSGSNYRSPIEGSCQNSKIIIIGAGAPDLDGDSDSAIKQLTGIRYCGVDNSCADDFSQWLRQDGGQRRDHLPLAGMQSIDVDVIELGSEPGLPLFKRIAEGGSYRQVVTAMQLQVALSQSIDTMTVTANSYLPAAVPVNNYQRMGLDDELYFALFQPRYSQRWHGNIKKYWLLEGEIVDANRRPAVDGNSGFFADNTLSQWSSGDGEARGDTSADGADIKRGGFAGRLAHNNQRRIYTYIGPSPGVGNKPIALGDAFLLRENNADIDPITLGLDPDSPDWQQQRQQVIRWANGATASGSHYSGDFIHGRPAVVNYRRDPECSDGNRSQCIDNTVFAPSNMGFMYAIDGATGDEIFAFIPQELLPNLGHYYRDDTITTGKKYGLDAPISLWRHDRDNNGQIDQDDHVFLYLAMRRGGNNYYALDVSDRSHPQLLWQIDGGGSSESGDFRDLAQTWSVPKKARVRWHCSSGCLDRDVLFFGGGYDTVHDSATMATSGDRGNALYMVDARTGELLWSAGKGFHHSLNIPQMENSIVADLSVNDVDGDGYSELIIAVDIQGNVWRFDFDADNNTHFATGGKIASLGGDGRAFRRFYNAPDVAYFSRRGEPAFLTISLSSGYRASPNSNEVDDRLFVLYDYHPLSRPEDGTGLVNYNYVNNSRSLRATDLGNIDSEPAAVHGWFKAFNGIGEKGLSATHTFDAKILLSTFIPSQGCNNSPGDGRIYILDALTGASRHPDNIPFQTLSGSGIAPQPLVIASSKTHCSADCDGPAPQFEQRSTALVCIGTRCRDDLLGSSLHKTFWRENQ